ncbi:MAG TPA: DotU family type VI secretion system protein [Burkholderiales bacterium]|nr:DotU family type VI secretion system protein [Burkholderiales bacterium]
MSEMPEDSDRTVIIPSPHGRSAQTVVRQPPGGPAPVSDSPPPAHLSGLNPLLAAANPLLDLVPQLRSTIQHPDPMGLRDALVRDIKAFEGRARAAGASPEAIIGARYALCTMLDEVAASTPWGSGVWAKQSLLALFHNETWGGEKFFMLLSKLAQTPAQNRDLLELLYACLALGFEGRYRVIDNGRAQLEQLRERLAQILRQQRGEYERELSPQWQPAAVKRHRFFAIVPLWAVFAGCGALLLLVYLTFSWILNSRSDPVFAKIQGIRAQGEPPKPVVRPPAPQPRLATFLAPEIQQGLVTVTDSVDRSVITIVGDGLFAKGSGSISDRYQPLIDRIGDELTKVPGLVKVTGHTDNQPIRSVRFPSNWHLSQERAKSVAAALGARMGGMQRITAEGRADSEPVAPNDSEANRAKNRRVEITLLVAAPAAAPAAPAQPTPPAK